MGKSLQSLIKKSSVFRLAGRANQLSSVQAWSASQIDGVIDFSLPAGFSKALSWSVKNKKPFVSGTTGLKPSQKTALKKASQAIPIFYGENMSGGIFLLNQWLEDLFYKNPRLSIEDIHHKDKKDKPSGTALRLKNSLPSHLREKTKIKSIRRGREFGRHRVLIETAGESLLLEHRAFGRELFAGGALQALLFIIKKKKGFYGPSDIYRKGLLY